MAKISSKTTWKQFFLYFLVFVLVILLIPLLVPLIALLILAKTKIQFISVLMLIIIDILILRRCSHIWKEMGLETTDKMTAKRLLESRDTPLELRNALNSFEMGIATLEDALIVGPYGAYANKVYDILKKQNFSFLKKEKKNFFIENYQKDFLNLLQGIRTNSLSSEDALVAWSFELLTVQQTKEILQKNGEDYPKTIQALSDSNSLKYRPFDEILHIFEKEKKHR